MWIDVENGLPSPHVGDEPGATSPEHRTVISINLLSNLNTNTELINERVTPLHGPNSLNFTTESLIYYTSVVS